MLQARQTLTAVLGAGSVEEHHVRGVRRAVLPERGWLWPRLLRPVRLQPARECPGAVCAERAAQVTCAVRGTASAAERGCSLCPT